MVSSALLLIPMTSSSPHVTLLTSSALHVVHFSHDCYRYPTSDSGLLDETYIRLSTTGPEFQGWLSNHGPTAADAMIRLGHGDEVERWVDRYSRRLEDAPAYRWEITQDDWQEVLGDASRLGDWIVFFDRELREEPWRAVLARWWPRLIDGAVASATHGLIRTGHAVRALLETPSVARRAELARALGYGAARHQRLPDHPRPRGTADPDTALAGVPTIGTSGGVGARLDDLARTASWPVTVARLQPATSAAQVPEVLDALVDAAVTHYAYWAHGNPIMLVHGCHRASRCQPCVARSTGEFVDTHL